jgi:phage anti-repressor protein
MDKTTVEYNKRGMRVRSLLELRSTIDRARIMSKYLSNNLEFFYYIDGMNKLDKLVEELLSIEDFLYDEAYAVFDEKASSKRIREMQIKAHYIELAMAKEYAYAVRTELAKLEKH